MPWSLITELDDPRLDDYRDLKQGIRERRSVFIAEGEKLVERLLGSGCEVRSVVCTATALELMGERLPPELPIYQLPSALISQLVGFSFHRGVLACGVRPVSPPLAACWAGLGAGERALLLVCPETRDPENLGTMIRTAAAFGACGVVVGRAGTDPFSRRVLRTSMGAVLKLPVVETENWSAVLDELHGAGFESLALVLADDAEPLRRVTVSSRVAVFLGNEDQGLPQSLIEQCRRKVTLPMAAGIDSLNVAVACGIVLHHLAEQGV